MTRDDQLTAGLARVALGQFPTVLQAAPRLSAEAGFPPVWVKREDLSGLALGGNKPRQLEFLMAAAIAEGAQAVITTAAAQSNFCRATAAAVAVGAAVTTACETDRRAASAFSRRRASAPAAKTLITASPA